jgi:hypothetical protein
MGTFFEDLGKKIGETAETVTNRAGEVVEVQKIKNQIRVLERGNESAYIALGQIIYRHYKNSEFVDSEAIGICEAIQNREESIEKYEQQISKVRGDVKCSNCGKSVAKEMAFCPYCGEKFPESSGEEADCAKEAKEHIVDVTEKAEEKTEAAAEQVKEKASDAADKVKEEVSDAADTVSEKVTDVGEKIKENLED